MLKKIIKKIIFPHTYSSAAYIKYLRRKGISIGNNCYVWSPNRTLIDIQRPEMLYIGDYCKITEGVTILVHDYSTSVTRRKFHEHIGNAAKTIIGDNVFIGMNSIILMGTKIGDNCIVGAGSIVSGTYPNNVVIAGNPAKIICSIDKYWERKKDNVLDSALNLYYSYKKRKGRIPSIEEMGNAYAWLYLPRTQETISKYSRFFCLSGDNKEEVIRDFLKSEGMFNSFEDFCCYADGEERYE